ncbi:conserved hypothetical protein [Thermoplasma acidophilum]|uniref:Glycosyl transferase family 1 domain-containing protein n=2 Tax=Thermoplasma acidophilum TaxID=2303 RepID=Q9HK99_THEAC|nr:conserved hypothetical protein [Thermoplasma acidophilum]
MIEPFFKVTQGSPYAIRFIKFAIFRLYSNLLAQFLIKKGVIVYTGSNAGNFQYQQPPSIGKNKDKFNAISSIFNLVIKVIDNLSIFNRKSIILAIYNSKFTMLKYRIADAKFHIVIYPGLLPEIPKVIFNEKEDIIITISRIDPDKSLENLLEIIPNGDENHYIIGYLADKQYAEFLQKNLKNSHFIFNATDKQRNDLLRRAKILIHPAMYEAAGIVFMEAMSYGVIPIAHNSGGAPEIVPKQYLYDSLAEAREKIKKYLSEYNETHFNELRREASRFLISKFHESIESAFTECFIKN